MKIGLIDLDTSHPGSWIPIIRELGHEVSVVWDGGTVWQSGYAEKFAAEQNIPVVAKSLEEMADLADAVIVHSCNWDLHISRAKYFIERGIPVLVDKPMAGNMADIKQLCRWADAGYRICGGSSLRFNDDVQQFLDQDEDTRGVPMAVLAGCGVDDFNYGIHAYSLLWSIFGSGAETVRYLGENVQKQVEIVWKDGRRGILTIGNSGNWLPFYATIVTSKGVHQLTVDASKIYKALLEKCLPYLAGEVENPPIPMRELVEPEIAAVAMMVSKDRGGAVVKIGDLSGDEYAYDGAAFGVEYKKIRTGG